MTLGPVEVLESLQSIGVKVEVCGDKLRLYQASKIPPDLKAALVKLKPEIIAHLRLHTSLNDIPFANGGYGGLPRAQVEAAEAIQDPVLRKYNVLAWIRTYMQYRDENHGPLYEAICKEQRRLSAILGGDRLEKPK